MGINNKLLKDMLGVNITRKAQVGYEPEDITRKVGETWTDSEGVEWEQKNGYRSKISKLASKGIAEKCGTCEKLIFQKWDRDTHNRFDKCYHCQFNYELDLKFMKIADGNKWQHWVRLQQLRRMDAIDKDMEQFVFNRHEENKIDVFDDSVANAIANDNVRQTMKKNKLRTQ